MMNDELAPLAGLADLAPEARDRAIAALQGGELFETLRLLAIQAMFGDPGHGGNRDRAGWLLLGYPGPKAEWSAAEQALR